MRYSEIIDEDFANAPEQDLFEMANLFPADTGLPMTVWISVKGGVRHDVRIKVNLTYGNNANPQSSAVVAVRPTPTVILGKLKPRDEKLVLAWVSKNAQTLIEYWNGTISTMQALQRLEKVGAPPV